MIGSVMILIGCLMESAYASFEVGLVALLFGLYVAIGCGCYRKKGQGHLDETCETHQRPVDTLYAQPPDDVEAPLQGYGEKRKSCPYICICTYLRSRLGVSFT